MTLPIAAVSTGAGGTLSGLRAFQIRHEEIAWRGLPRALDGFRIGQITDLHVGAFIDPEHLSQAVSAMNEARVDLQVMTGDLIDDLSQLDATFAALDRCEAQHGMIAVLGNHEKWRGLEAVLAAYARSAERGGAKLLVDTSLVLEHAGASLRVVGVDYPMNLGGSHALPRAQREVLMRGSAARDFAGVAPGEPVRSASGAGASARVCRPRPATTKSFRATTGSRLRGSPSSRRWASTRRCCSRTTDSASSAPSRPTCPRSRRISGPGTVGAPRWRVPGRGSCTRLRI
jgi:hypothetical protein